MPTVFDAHSAYIGVVEKLAALIGEDVTTLSSNTTWTNADARTAVFTCSSPITLTMAQSTEIEGALYFFILKGGAQVISFQTYDFDSLPGLSHIAQTNALALLFLDGDWVTFTFDLGAAV